ncbi:MAG: TolC family protein [Deltaproteobacteria bacterium]
MKRSRLFFMAFFLLAAAPAASAQGVTGGAAAGTLDGYVEEALAHNPALKAALLKWREAAHLVGPAGTLPDPMVSYTYFGANVETRVGPQEAKYGISQKVPYPGKLSLKSRTAATRADILKAEYLAARDELVKNVRWAYCDLYWVDRALAITEEEKALLERVEKVASKKYETKLVPYQDVVKAQAELSRLIDKLVMFKQNRKALEAHFNALLNRPVAAEIPVIREIGGVEGVPALPELQRLAEENRPELAAGKLGVKKAKFEKNLADLSFVPDMTVGFDYIDVASGHTMAANDGQDAWMAMVAFNVPLWFGSIHDDIRSKEAALEASQNAYQDMENSVGSDVEDIYFKLKAYEDVVTLYETALIPQATQAFEASQKGYESGTTDFLNWLDSERVLLQARLAYYRALVDYHKTRAFLERVTGVALSAPQDDKGRQEP